MVSLIQDRLATFFQGENGAKFFIRSRQMSLSESQFAAFKAITRQAQ